jgi:AcrR family transcriptional regulator
MSPRRYTLGKREAGVEENRRAIIEAARALIAAEGFHRASLVDVARQAGVTRATVYQHFGSKLGLLEAVATDALERAGLNELPPLLQMPDARDAWEVSTRAAVRMWTAEHELFRKVIGLAGVDPEARQIVEQRDGERRSAMEFLVARLAEQGYLRPGRDPARALATLTLLTSFPTFDSLYTVNGLAPAAIADLLIDLSGVVIGESADEERSGSAQ